MSLALRYQLPRFLIRGEAATLTAEVVDTATNAPQTVSLGGYSLFAGSTNLLDNDSITAIGPPAEYAIAAAVTEGKALAADWQERWALTIGGVTTTFERPVYLVRFTPKPVIIDADLFTRHRSLDRLRSREDANYSPQRDEAFIWLQRRLISKGNRPSLLLDESELREAHIAKTLHLIFRDAAASVNADPSYAKLSEEYEREAKAAFEDVPLTYDTDGDGFDDESTKRVATSIVMLNRPPRWGRY